MSETNMRKYMLLLIMIVLSSGSLAQTLPSLEEELNVRVEASRNAGQPESVRASAKAFIDRFGRRAVPYLADGLLRMQIGDRGFTNYALVNAIDPEDRHGLQSNSDIGIPVGIAAISLSENDSEQLLTKLATGKYSSQEIGDSVSVYACGFLRAHEPSSVRLAILSSLTNQNSQQQDALRSLLAAFAYSDQLAPEQRTRYAAFEKMFWWNWATTRKNQVGWSQSWEGAAVRILEKWEPRDDVFLIHRLRSPMPGDTGWEVIMAMAGRRKVQSVLPDLKAIAESKSPQADVARYCASLFESPTPRP